MAPNRAAEPIVPELPTRPPIVEITPVLSELSEGATPELPPLPAVSTPSTAVAKAGDQPLRFAVPKSNITLAPQLRLDGGISSNPLDVPGAPPQQPGLNPTPGLAATMDLGAVTLGTQLNRPLRTSDSRFAPDGRPISSQPNVGLDLKLKF